MYLAELLGHALPVTGDVAQALADAFLRERAIGGEVEEVVFFDGELCELVFEVLAEQLLRGDLVVERGFDVVTHGGDERGAEADGLVVLGDGAFGTVDRGIRGVADVVLHASAEKVAVVGVAVPAGRTREDHASVDVLLEAALPAPDGALEVMVVPFTAFAGVAAFVHELLYLVEQILGDERFVPGVPVEPSGSCLRPSITLSRERVAWAVSKVAGTLETAMNRS